MKEQLKEQLKAQVESAWPGVVLGSERGILSGSFEAGGRAGERQRIFALKKSEGCNRS
jgi:hypothetical protein